MGNLLNKAQLEKSPVVANCSMNRVRRLCGTNGYEVEIGFDPLDWLTSRLRIQRVVRWLDMLRLRHSTERCSRATQCVWCSFPTDNWRRSSWYVRGRFVKLRVLQLAGSWLAPAGRFAANLDIRNICIGQPGRGHRTIARSLRDAGFQYDSRKNLIQLHGNCRWQCPFSYIGADDQAGPNYTKQPVVNSFYQGG